MKIGVFDSGIGGKSVAIALKRAFPELEISYAQDKQHAPYGQKTAEELKQLVMPFMQAFEAEECEVIVIACNTVTTNIISYIRQRVSVPVVGIEPMIKPAALSTKSKKIAVCATPATLKSSRYHELKNQFAKGIEVFEPDCSDWSSMIEAEQVDHKKIKAQIEQLCRRGADVIVLGCTHYHWIEQEIKAVAKKFNAVVLQPEQAIVNRVMQVLELPL